MNFRLHVHGTVDSTNERAFEAIASGTALHGDVHVAEEQTAGRGRRGASWVSAAGEGLYASVILLPPAPPLHPAALTMAAGLAVQRAVRSLGADRAELKWPNDVVVAGAKLSGILVETRGLDPLRPHYVIGIGVNVGQTSFPTPLTEVRAVTSLAMLGVHAEVHAVRDAVLVELAQSVELALQRSELLASAFLDATGLRGRAVEVEMPDARIQGTWTGVTLARGLEVTRTDGTRVELALEHVRQVRAAQERA